MKLLNAVHRYDNDIIVCVYENSIEIMSISVYASDFLLRSYLDDSDFIWKISMKEAIDLSTTELYNDFRSSTSCSIMYGDFAKLIQRARVARTVITH